MVRHPDVLVVVVLENVTHKYDPSRGVRFAVLAAISSRRSNGATDHTSCPIQLSELSNIFL